MFAGDHFTPHGMCHPSFVILPLSMGMFARSVMVEVFKTRPDAEEPAITVFQELVLTAHGQIVGYNQSRNGASVLKNPPPASK